MSRGGVRGTTCGKMVWHSFFKAVVVFSVVCLLESPLAEGRQGYNLPDNAGTEFLLAFPAGITNKKALIRATSYLDTTVQIFGLNDQQIGSNITLSSAGLVHEETLSEPVVSGSGRTGQFNSWLIKANDEITVYGRGNKDGYMALPTDVLGKEYYVASYQGSTGRSRVVMIGVHDRTMVRITLTAGVTFEGAQDRSGSHTYSSGQDIILEVHRMETVQFVASTTAGDLTGTRVISDKPIAVLSGTDGAVVGSGDAGYMVEYLPPVYTWGSTFVVKPLNGGTDKVRVIASQLTDYSINGANSGPISAGSFASIDVSAVTVIQADYPVLVAQYTNGGSGRAPSMTVIPPVEQYTSDYGLAAISDWTNSAILSVSTAQETGVMSEITTAVSGWSQESGYSATTKNMSPGATTATFQHNSLQGAFGVVQYGTAGGESYSYPGGQRFAPINPCVVSADDGLHADGLDNDCDGLVDEGGPEDRAYSPLPPDLYVDRHSTTELDFSWRGFRMARVANFKRELGEAGTLPTVPMADVGRIIKSVESNNLFPGRKYEFKVIAVDVSGAESEPAIIVFPTDPDPPNDLLLLSITHNSISLDWNPPVVGGVTNYEVTYTNIMDGQTFTTLVPGDRTSATISGLQPMTEYQFTVTTVFFGVSSARSSQEVAVTKLEPPINMHVESTSTTSSFITVSLDRVSGSAPPLTKALQFATYEISYGNYTGDAIPKPGEGATPYRPFTPPSFEATGLLAGANYVMYVRSNYDGNSSEPVILRESTFPNPPADLWVESSGTTYIELAWDRPTSGNLEGYIITHGIVGRPTSKQSQIITDTGMTLNGLSVEHEYEIAVSVYSNGKESEAVTLTKRPSVVHVWSTWSAYSPCSQSCGDGVRTRTRQCHHVDGSPSIECEGAAGKALQTQEIACDLDHCPVHGGWTSWEAWGACSQSCGAAVQQRVRSCSDPTPVFGGKGCPGSRTQQRQCHQDPCAADGEWSEWREYSECTLECGRGTQQRTRVCLGQEGTGAPCEGPAVETRRCNEMPCPADGRWSEWSEWGQCSVSCGGGIANRTRACDNPAPGWGGRDCEGNDTEIQGCGSDPCPGEVYWSTWSDFSPCPATCGNATHSRTRACMNGTTVEPESVCNGTTADTQDWKICTNNPCPVDGGWGAWMEWSRCTRRCGGGTRQRTRICNNPAPEYAGQRCDGDSDGRGIQTVTGQCNEHLCSNMPKCRTVRGRCGVVWNEVEAEEIQNVSCADQDGVFGTRKCGRYGHWEEEDFTRCTSPAMEEIYGRLSQINGKMMAVTDLDEDLKRLLADPGCLQAGDLLKAKRLLTSLVRLKPLLYEDGSRARREQYIDDMLEIASLLYGRPYFDQWADIQETVGIQEVTNITDVLEELCDTVLEYMTNTREEMVLARSSNIDMDIEMYKTYQREPFSFPKHTRDTHVILPKALVASAIPGRQEVPVCAFDHHNLHHLLEHLAERNNKHMTTRYHHERELNSKVVTATIIPTPPAPLANKVEIHFRHRWRGQDPLCVFIDKDDPYSIYNPSGCSVVETTDYSTVCRCNHFSSYALLTKHYVETVINTVWISWLPLAGSIVCLISTCAAFLSHLLLRKYLSNRCLVAEKFLVILLMASAIFVSGVNGTFLPGSHKIFIFMDTCQFKAVMLHYLFLATFSWLMVGALQLYMDCIKATPWWLLYHVIGWILPLFIQAITIPWKSDVFLASNYCWVSWEQGLHWSLFVPEIVLCLITVVIISIAVYMEDQQALLEPEKYTERMHTYIWRNILQLPLFVLSWTLGLVAMETENYATQVFFGLSLMFLGLFVAVVYIIQNREIRYAYYTVIHLLYTKYRGSRQTSHFPKAYIDPKNPPVYIP
ncbi:uncharacterized protein LOC118430123 [Branchiostoma floridae]|uniref:Uncharacterized protein LOC118430123 n=1 Tax=Branchiostoma floridae TaxID=7739 RepID=A0A9J7M8I8_BRAFL|nr:uncharacterized protein LOC118430123 [Branchiostoma floridae]